MRGCGVGGGPKGPFPCYLSKLNFGEQKLRGKAEKHCAVDLCRAAGGLCGGSSALLHPCNARTVLN